MKFWFTNTRDQILNWTVRHAKGAHAKFWLVVFSFMEASFFPIPPDILLIAILLTNSARWFWYCLITTLSSVAGGIFGYLIGCFFFVFIGEPLIAFYNLETSVAQVRVLFDNNAFWAIFLAAFTPIPFKVFTIAAGLFNINFGVFLIASLLGRGMRFFAIGYLLRRFGKKISAFLYKYFNIFSLFFAFLIIVAVVCSTWK